MPIRTAARLLTGFTLLLSAAGVSTAGRPDFYHDFGPFVAKYCVSCHDADEGVLATGVDLESVASERVLRDDESIEAILHQIESGSMPPGKAAQPTDDERTKVVTYLERVIIDVQDLQPDDPGIVVMPRLNHNEYDRVIEQLTGEVIDASKYLPTDPQGGEGFLNVGFEQAVTAGQIEKYLDAANYVLSHAKVTPATGISWEGSPVPALGTPAQLRTYLVNDWTSALRRSDNDIFGYGAGDRRRKWTNADVLFALWKHHHSPNKSGPEDFSKLGPTLDPPIAGPVLANWYEFLGSMDLGDKRYDEFRKEFFGDWYELPPPGGISDKDARKICEEVAEPYTMMENVRTGGDEQEKQVDFFGNRKASVKKGSDIWFTINTGGKPRGTQYAIIKSTEFRFNKSGDLGDRWNKHWPELVSVDGRKFEWGKGIRGVKVGKDEAIVELPVTFKVPVPKGCTAIRANAKLDEKLNPNGRCQPFFSTRPPSKQDLVFKEGENLLGVGFNFKALEDLVEVRKYFGVPGKPVRTNQPYLAFSQFEKFPIRYLDVATWPNVKIEDGKVVSTTRQSRLDEIIGGNPTKPRFLSMNQLRAAAGSDLSKRIDSLELDLEWAAQIPLQELRALLVDNGRPSAVEGDRATEEDFKKMSYAQRRDYEKLLGEVEAFEAKLEGQARPIVAEFAEDAWRREVSSTEVDRLLVAYQAERAIGGSFDAAVKQSLKAVMISPDFLFRPSSIAGGPGANPKPLSDLALANRLAFVLWAAAPDEELLELARAGRLKSDDELKKQVRRMLKDDKSEALATDFAGQWLGYADFDRHTRPNPERFPEYDQALREAMYEEVVRFMHDMFKNDASITNLIDSDYTYANGKLAEFYGLPKVKGDRLQKVNIPQDLKSRRGGLFGMGAVLTRTSTALRTSPVLRGAWLYKTVLGNPMPEPPPDVEMISMDETDDKGRTIAEQLAEHRASQICATCHDKIDPPGVVLEHFDPIGRWRDNYNAGNPVIDESRLQDGREIDGLGGLRQYLESEQDRFYRQFSKKLLAYSLGRNLLITDKTLIQKMVATLKANRGKPARAIEAIILSRQFRYRRDATSKDLAGNN
ncbi:DUF1592 domain-containing protein [Stratiformator vulcanicus]|uniref:Cytochrome c domain-containing protein n=1 Tax=Stratiformator vulcanicus TaxID=2527980 RepID=A0A517QYR1_9PLAN|nr:DUF1592 domain-containing protein [Stratiformator vulcanicus]QDT36789.1 hypothetical protein Pan189_11520 [Stratiformator vulcanicus]